MESIKVITLTQPWATLMEREKKRIETRSWSTRYRGPLAIHAAQGFPRWAVDLCKTQPFASALFASGYLSADALPRGVILAIGDLARIEKITAETVLPDEPERSFGDYTEGRYMWFFENMRSFIYPVPAKGKLSIWDFPIGPVEEDYRKRYEAR